MSESFYIEISSAEREELDAIIERWGNPDNYSTPAERLMVSGLYPLLLQLKSVTTVPVVPTELPAESWFDLPEITDGEQIISNNPHAPYHGVHDGSAMETQFELPDGIDNLDAIDNGFVVPGPVRPLGFVNPATSGQEWAELIPGEVLVEL